MKFGFNEMFGEKMKENGTMHTIKLHAKGEGYALLEQVI